MAILDKVCVGCGVNEEDVRLEKCGICARYFCIECAHRAYGGRRFCSPECARGYYFHGEMDDDDDDEDFRIEE
jgi:hypothetical protein